jgi:hypothetical protein
LPGARRNPIHKGAAAYPLLAGETRRPGAALSRRTSGRPRNGDDAEEKEWHGARASLSIAGKPSGLHFIQRARVRLSVSVGLGAALGCGQFALSACESELER